MRKLSNKEFINKANLIHNFKYDYSKTLYSNILNKIIIICPIHGEFFQKPSNHLFNKRGCSSCNGGVKLTQEEYVVKCKSIHKCYYNYSKTIFDGVKSKVIIICPVHGEFSQTAEKHFYHGCTKCSSNSSKKEKVWLDYHNVPNDCRNVYLKIEDKRFIVDGLINNVVYEFLGDFWHGHPVKYDKDKINTVNKITFEELFNNTVTKIRFLRRNGYKVISIWESTFDKRKI